MARIDKAALAGAVSTLLLAGCAGGAAGPETDPYQGMNRFFYRVNGAITAVALRPAALAYLNGVPAPARTGVHNVLNNLDTPVLLANDLLQGSLRRSGTTSMRFLINSTIGVGGIFDVADGFGYKFHDTDFGITLALWGVAAGPYLYLPILGPSNPRDAIGFGVDGAADPLNYIGKGAVVSALRYTRLGMTAIDKEAEFMGQLSAIDKTALDPYATLRSLYQQNRQGDIAATRADEAGTKRGTPAP